MADPEFDIDAAYDAIADDAAPAPVAPAAESEAAPAPEEVAEAEAAAIGDEFDAIEAEERTRDEKGRFIKKGELEALAPAADVVGEDVEAAQTNAAPEHLPKELRDAWSGFSDEVRQAIELREQRNHQLFTRMDGERERGRSFDQLVAPYQDMIAAEGGNALAAASELFDTARMLRNPDPAARAQVLNLIAARFNIDIEQAYYSRPDPQVAQRDIQLMQTQGQLANYQAAERAQFEAGLQQQVEEFAASHPHFGALSPRMVNLIEKGVCGDLQSAYDIAMGADETLRSASIEQAVQERLAAEEASRAGQIAKARRAAISPTSAPGTAKPPGSSPNLTPEEHIALDYDRVMAALE